MSVTLPYVTDIHRQTPLRASGYVDSLAFDGSAIYVFRNRKTLETIPLTAVDAINVRAATRLVNGAIEIVQGGNRARSIVYTYSHRSEFQVFVEQVRAARAKLPPAEMPQASPDAPLVAYGIEHQAVTFDGYTLAVYAGDRLIQQASLAQLLDVSVTPIRPAGGNFTMTLKGGARIVVGFRAADRPGFSAIADATRYTPRPSSAQGGPGTDPWTASSLPVAQQAPQPASRPGAGQLAYGAGMSPRTSRNVRRLLTLSMWTEGLVFLWLLIPALMVVAICGWTLFR